MLNLGQIFPINFEERPACLAKGFLRAEAREVSSSL